MLGVDFNGKSIAEMSLQYLAKSDPPSYNAPRQYMTSSEQSNIENKTQQHSINDILSSNKQGEIRIIYHLVICRYPTLSNPLI